MPIKLAKGAKGHNDRVSVCGRYVIEMTAMGCRHEPGPYYGARLAEMDNGTPQWIGSDVHHEGIQQP